MRHFPHLPSGSILAALCVLGTGVPGAGIFGANAAERRPAVGVGGFVRPGAWVPLTAGPDFGADGPVAVRVTDGDGLRLERTPPVAGGAALVQAGRAESTVEIVGEGTAPLTLRPGEDFTVLAPDERLWAAVGLPPALRRLNERGEVDPNAPGPVDRPGAPVRIAAFGAGEDLPAVPHGLGTVRALLIEASALPADDAFLRDWVAGGGHLILSLDAAGELPDWVPLAAGDPVPFTARSALERLAKAGSGRGTAAVINKLAPAAARPLDAADVLAADGRVLASGDGGALVAELPLGFGRVTAVAVSLHAPPLSGWAGLPAFLLELTRAAPGGGLGDSPPAGEIAGQVYGALEADAVGGLSPGAVGVWALALLVVIGPLDYLLVHRLLNRPALTWVTLPVWLIGAAGLAWWAAGAADPTPRRLEIVDVDVAAGRLRGAAWATVPAPAAGRLDVTFAPSAPVDQEPAHREEGEPRLGYAAEPGATFGGLYRGGGVGLVPANYRIDDAEAIGVPLPERSSKRLRLDWDGPANDLVSSRLSAGETGLTGTLSHRFPGTLSDYFLVYRGRVYRPDPVRSPDSGAEPGTLPAGVDWGPGEAGVLRRDLRGFLTQVREVRERQTGFGGGGDEASKYDDARRLVRTRYAARSRDFGVILPALSLYAQSGGAAFTGLSNAELEGLDLSATANTGRALLFGRLDAPLTDLRVTFGVLPREERDPASEAPVTYLRVVLPVADGSAPAEPADAPALD